MGSRHPLQRAIEEQPQLTLWITHLWQRLAEHKRLGLVLGAGVSYDAKIPLWGGLVERLAKAAGLTEDRMKLHQKERFPETFLAEILFRHHTASQIKNASDKHHDHRVNSSWKKKIRECLYRDLGGKPFEAILEEHPYLEGLATLACKAGFTVTLNFDDIVDQAVAAHVGSILDKAPDSEMANPEIIYHPKIETRKHAPVIYHINGSLPRDELRRSSEHVLLTEDAFADVLLSPNSQNAEFVINQFAVRTFMLLGLSLSDNSLKNILRSSAKRNPANHHFYIIHELDDEPRSKEARDDIFEVNLHVYNLVTIFLTTSEIKALINVLNSASASQFDEAILESGAKSTIHRKYYVVGSVASGKSATIDALRCFTTFEEFSGRVPAQMYQDDKTLSSEDQKIVDDYLFPQLVKKNGNMMRVNSGIRIMDRAFFDLFAFSKDGDEGEIERKAIELRNRVGQYGKALENGSLIFLRASPEALEERLLRRGTRNGEDEKKGFEPQTLEKQEQQLKLAYKIDDKSVLDTSDLDQGEVAREIARKILLGEYVDFDFSTRLEEIIKHKGKL